MNLIFGVGIVLIVVNIGYTKAIGKITDNFFDFYSALKFPNELSTKKIDTFSYKNKKIHQSEHSENLLPEKQQNLSKFGKNTSFNSGKNKRVFIMPKIYHMKNVYLAHECKSYLKYQSGLDWHCTKIMKHTDDLDNHLDKYCYCWLEYDCIENEQFYFDFDTEEEKINLNESLIKNYEKRCENGMKEFTNVKWNCTIQVYDNELDLDADNLSNFDSYCDCYTKKKCHESKN
ncbi:hypothetical protein BpHYR1_033411 [Brachionus plicatilis]|uniref:Uncharacterized protein n=1 Tax=Brachionus plicatilis TaxID=10195 RepID=A0A3M7R9A8_BRAPC|nr:hypothetical protein BpHYR1_033411 [Brachionus plicatilis]